MKFALKNTNIITAATSCLVIGVFQDKNPGSHVKTVDSACGGLISELIKNKDISGKTGQTLLLHKVSGLKAKKVLLVGCGKATNLNSKSFQLILNSVSKCLNASTVKDALVTLAELKVTGQDTYWISSLISRSLEASQYRYSRTKSGVAPKFNLNTVHLFISDKTQHNLARKGLANGSALAKGICVARELGNLPANICTPTYLAQQAIALGKKHKILKTKILSEAQMKRLGMGSLLSVSAGSVEPAAFIIMEYKGAAASVKPNVIVGKGITFDTGGISLKPGGGMDEMKFDMCGAASVMGTMTSLCELQAKTNVVGIIASAENMPSGIATKPGDVVTSMSGQTIEVLNTDAEGRLVLCDALTYAERFQPKSVVDIATLTGACVVALGAPISGLMSNDDELADKLYQCGLDSLDPVWRLPIWDEYQKQLDSNFADIANIGGSKAGAITAGCFLSRFTKKYKWAHIDIAGTGWLQGAQKGATGRPVALLLNYLLNN